jgi:hypothetical protein
MRYLCATFDQVSRGRLVLGIGTGWQPNEHAAHGIPLPSGPESHRRLDEACAVIRSLLDQQRSEFDGAVGDRDVQGTSQQVLSQLLAFRGAAPAPASPSATLVHLHRRPWWPTPSRLLVPSSSRRATPINECAQHIVDGLIS